MHKRRNNNKKINFAQILLIGSTYIFTGIIFVLPLVLVIQQAFSKGFLEYLHIILDNDSFAAIKLTFIATVSAVSLNTVFGIAAAWVITKHEFRGKNILVSSIDIPFSVSPVVSGLLFVLLFGAQGWFGSFLTEHNIKIIFAVPGIILATTFVTFPFVVRELIPVMNSIGTESEEAAVSLGANGWMLLFRVTLPSVRWGLLYGVTICTARAMGEFGAVSVVSGHIRGMTTTIPLQAEMLYNEYNFTAAFAMASILMCVSVITVIFKSIVEQKKQKSIFELKGQRTVEIGRSLINDISK